MTLNDSCQQVGEISCLRTDNYESCEIRIKGYLDEHWSEYLGNLVIAHDCHGNSVLSGLIPDQAALHGILAQIRDLGLSLISVTLCDPDFRGDVDDSP